MNERQRQSGKEEVGVIYFDAVEVGRSLKEVAVDTIKTDTDEILSRWYHSEREADIYLWMDGRKNIIKQQVHLYGQLIEWNILDGVRTGMTVETEKDNENLSETVCFDAKPSVSSVKQALAVVAHAGQVPDGDRQVLLANFQEGKTLNDIATEEFLRRFGTRKEEVSSTFWDRLRQWIKF